MRKKRIKKIFNKLTQIAQKGKDYFVDYCVYIDGLISGGQYNLLQDVFSNYYLTDIIQYNSISVLKQKTWDVVRFNTNSPFQYRLKEYYDLKGVYQVGKNIYNLETNELLGTFTETDKLSSINYLGVTYSYYPQQPYYKDPELFKKLDEAKVVQLEVLIGGFAFDDRVTLDDPNVDLLTKYKIGVEILITQNPSANIYLDDNYLEDYLD